MRTGAYASALRETTAGLRLVESGTSREAIGARATLLAMRSEVRSYQGHPRDAIAIAQRALDDAQQVDELPAMAKAYMALDGSYQLLGEPEKAVNERKALVLYQQMGDLRSAGITQLNLGVQAYSDGLWAEAVTLYRDAQESCRAAGDLQHVAIAGANLGEALVSLGRLDEAEAVLVDARRTLRASRFAPFALFADTQLARVHLARGDVELALTELERIVGDASGLGHPGIALDATIHFAQAQALGGDPALGLEELEKAARAAGDEAAYFIPPTARARAACLLALGRDDEAEAQLTVALAEAERQGVLYEQLLARQAQLEIVRRRGEQPTTEELREVERLAQLLGLAG